MQHTVIKVGGWGRMELEEAKGVAVRVGWSNGAA